MTTTKRGDMGRIPRLPRAPFFELGVKNYLFGDDVLDLARCADELAARHDIDLLMAVPYVDIRRVSEKTDRLIVLAPHMDLLPPGRGLAEVLPEGIQAAGAGGVMINHTERPLPAAQVRATIGRAQELGMLAFVCASSIVEAVAMAHFAPDILNPEPAELIGGGAGAGVEFLRESVTEIRKVAPEILIEQAGGISEPAEVYTLVAAGADGVGVASGVAANPEPERMLREMVEALVAARPATARQSIQEKEQC